jgi:predicted ABC-type ATPase
MSEKKAVFTFARMNPPTTGHKKLIDAVKSHAHKIGAEHHIFLSHTHDSKKNPLTHKQKVEFVHKMSPGTHVHEGEHVKTAIDAAKHLHKKGYTHVHMVVGSDRQHEFHNLLHKYNGKDKEYHFKHLEVHSAGHRDPDAEGVSGMSASKMREHAKHRRFGEFRKGVPNKAHAKDLYHAVRKGMKLENFQNHFKAIFLVGGPGSGKDFIINSLLDETKIIELPLDKLVKAITEKSNLDEFDRFPSLIINGTAENLNKILVSKSVLESMGYDTGMIYVYTSDEESKARNDERIDRGSKTFTEEVRLDKYSASIENMHNFSDVFDPFFIYDNSNNFSLVSETKKTEIVTWLEELGENLSNFFSDLPNNEAAKIWLMEDTGIASSAKNKSNQAGAEDSLMNNNIYKFKKLPGKKTESKKKSAGAPPNFFDARMGAVPSGGIGLVATTSEEKTFTKFRKNINAIVNNVDGE